MITTHTRLLPFLSLLGLGALVLQQQHQPAHAFLLPFGQHATKGSGALTKLATAPTTTSASSSFSPLSYSSSLLNHVAASRRAGKGTRKSSTRLMMSTKANNQMNPESYTEKAWDVITRLPQLATRAESQFIDTETLLKSLLEEGPQALANRIFFKAGVKVSQLENELEAYIASQPKVPDAPNKVCVCIHMCVCVWLFVYVVFVML
jgi:hypothetical protein